RDFHVTGVQTCALPISTCASAGYPGGEGVADLGGGPDLARAGGEVRGDGGLDAPGGLGEAEVVQQQRDGEHGRGGVGLALAGDRSEEHTSELQSRENLV